MGTPKNSHQRHLVSLILIVITVLISNSNQEKLISPTQYRYSRLASDENDGFVPIVQPAEMVNTISITSNNNAISDKRPVSSMSVIEENPNNRNDENVASQENLKNDANEERSISIRLQDVRNLLTAFLQEENNKAKGSIVKRSADGQRALITDLLLNEEFINRVKKFTEQYIFQAGSGSAYQSVIPHTGRFFLFKGFKKLMWPIFIGIQVAKTVLLAMFLPSILGSIGKMVGKGLVSSSGFGQPTENVDDFEFKDNTPTDDQANGMGYNYQQQTLTANHANVETAAGSYDTAPAANNMLSLYDIADPKPQYTMANAYQLPEYARKESLQSKKDDFKVFHDIPASSMLLTNYDPFYSPLLSRLDAVFNQLNLGSDNETCREKLVCLMYASPAKYMPYSNLVSAQLSRELNELRKPTSDNVEILRFFKYMRAARDGQDGKNCHNTNKKCSSFTDTEQPAMLTTYNDINKLVQARKLR